MPINQCRCGHQKGVHVGKVFPSCTACRCYSYDERFDSEGVVQCEDTSDPVCPGCGATVSDWFECGFNDGDEIEIDCGSCEVEFRCTMTVTYSFESIPGKSEEEKAADRAKDAERRRKQAEGMKQYLAKRATEGKETHLATCPSCGEEIKSEDLPNHIDSEHLAPGAEFTWPCPCGVEVSSTVVRMYGGSPGSDPRLKRADAPLPSPRDIAAFTNRIQLGTRHTDRCDTNCSHHGTPATDGLCFCDKCKASRL